MITKNVTTIELDGNETAVEFAESYPYFWITNKGSADIYVSLSAGIVPKADGVYTIVAGGSERIGNGYRADRFYILGSGEVYIRGEEIAAPPSFKKGGEGGGENVRPIPKVLLEARDKCELKNGLTGFTILNQQIPQADGSTPYRWISVRPSDNMTNGVVLAGMTLNFVPLRIHKSYGLTYSNDDYIDSLLVSTDDTFDLTKYNAIGISYITSSDYGGNSISNFGDSYFRIDEPDTLPQSKIAYDWTGWDSMWANDNRIYKRYYKDISNVTGEHKLCFGLHHGTYSGSFSNGLAIMEIVLF